ncbi:MAG: SLBB domain-containing protein [Acidobacteriota bacterium]
MMRSLVLLVIAVSLTGVHAVTAQVPPTAASTQAERGYLVGPGDEITGKVLGETQFDFVTTVDEDGKIEVPFFDKPVIAKCRSERELRTDIGLLLARYLKNPQISIRVTDRKSRPPATIYGEVRTPQQIILMRKATLVDVLAFSGGVTEEAGGMIQVFRTRPPLCGDVNDESDWKADAGDPTDVPSRMFSLSSVKLGKEDANPVIYPGDVIVVQKASPVYITGEVVAPQGIYLKEGGLSLTEAIAKIGGVKREAKTRDIKIYRLKAGSKERDVIAVNYDLIKKGQQKDVMLEPYDIVEVDHAKKGIAQTILEIAAGAARTGITSATGGIGTRILY